MHNVHAFLPSLDIEIASININHRDLAIIVTTIRLTMTTAKDILWNIITVT